MNQADNNITATPRRALRVNEFCDAYRISRSTVYRLIADGQLKTVKVGTDASFQSTPLRRFFFKRRSAREYVRVFPHMPRGRRHNQATICARVRRASSAGMIDRLPIALPDAKPSAGA